MRKKICPKAFTFGLGCVYTLDMNHTTTRNTLRADINRALRGAGLPFATIRKDALNRCHHVDAEGIQTTRTDDAVNVLYRVTDAVWTTPASVRMIRTAASILTEMGYTVTTLTKCVNFGTEPDTDTLAVWGIESAKKGIVGWVAEVPSALVVTR